MAKKYQHKKPRRGYFFYKFWLAGLMRRWMAQREFQLIEGEPQNSEKIVR